MYLKRRHRKWWAFHDVPPSLRPVLGKKRFATSLETEDEKTAKRRADALWLHDWSRKIEEARSGSPAVAEDEAGFYRRLLREARSDEERELITDQIADEARERAIRALTKAGYSDWPEDGEDTTAIPGYDDAHRFAKLATGQMIPTLEHMEDWLSLIQNEEKSKDLKRGALTVFAKSFPYVQDIKPEAVQRWFNNRARDEGLAQATLKRIQSQLRGYWKHLQSLGIVPRGENPFADLTIHGAVSIDRKPFTPAEVVALRDRAKAKGDETLADLITLAMWTGARIESLCALKVENVRGDFIKIEGDKTDAGTREVPIHSRLMPTIERLCRETKDGYVLSNLPVNKYGDRSDALGKMFGRLKTAAGFGESHVFHSIRGTVVTILDNAGVPENVTADIVGHEKPRITYGLYSGGSSMAVKREAIERLAYPTE